MKKKGWVKPMQDYLKLNVDVSFDADDLWGAIGAIIRDSHGSFVVACRVVVQSSSMYIMRSRLKSMLWSKAYY
jgi:hypothetical protein